MLSPGLVSITFRRLPPAAVVRLCVENGLEGIEWGGDVHAPHGDIAAARDVGAMTRAAGLAVAAYGSYYRAGVSESGGLRFSDVLDSACAMGAPLIRVWAGACGSARAAPNDRKAVADDALRVADMAAARGVSLAWEWHGNTLTDTRESAFALLREASHPALGAYWQPQAGRSPEACLGEIEGLGSRLRNLHVFHWDSGGGRQPLDAGEDAWSRYLSAASAAPGGPRWVLLEFVRDDSPANLPADAKTLHSLLRRL